MMSPSPCGPGDSHDLECEEFLGEVYLYLDSECDEVRRAQLQQHMAQCPGCLDKYGLERDIKALVGRCCGGERAPENLRSRVQAQIRSAVSIDHAETLMTDGSSYIRSSRTTIRYESRPIDPSSDERPR